MKKLFGIGALVIMLSLAGCGKGNTLTCTGSEGDEKVKVTVNFKNDKVSKITQEYTFATEEEAQMTYAFAQLGGDEIKASIKGKKVTLSMSGSSVSEGYDGKTSKADIKKAAEADGYTCK